MPPTTFVEVIHPSLKYVPFTGLEVTSDFYYDVLSTLITPVNLEYNKFPLNKTKDLGTNISGLSNLSTRNTQGNDTPVGVKLGSLQMFVKSKGAVENFGPDKFPKDEVHKIAILDLRLLNLDRNEQNILVNIVPKIVMKNGK